MLSTCSKPPNKPLHPTAGSAHRRWTPGRSAARRASCQVLTQRGANAQRNHHDTFDPML